MNLYKVTTGSNGDVIEYYVEAIDYNSAEKVVKDYFKILRWDRFGISSISLIGEFHMIPNLDTLTESCRVNADFKSLNDISSKYNASERFIVLRQDL